jgi:hypothetical protein
VQDIGWQCYVADGQVARTVGQSKRIEAVRVILVNDGDAHAQLVGPPSARELFRDRQRREHRELGGA